MMKRKIVVVGGGTGTYTVLNGLKKFTDKLDLSVIVSMMDSGGSNRILRDEFGLLPTSDIRQCLVALSSDDAHETLQRLFTYRYNQGTGISGMTFGNLFMAALTDIYGSQRDALKKTSEVLSVKGNIYPVTYDHTHLFAKYDNGIQVLGEHYIDEAGPEIGESRIAELRTIPESVANPDAVKAIKDADYIVMGPGDLYTSVICNFVVGDLADALHSTKAKKIYVMNLMTKYGETKNFKASDHIKEIEKYSKSKCDYCLVNNNNNFQEEAIDLYKTTNASPVEDDLDKMDVEVVRADLLADEIFKKAKGDKLRRSLIRHDSDKLAATLLDVFTS